MLRIQEIMHVFERSVNSNGPVVLRSDRQNSGQAHHIAMLILTGATFNTGEVICNAVCVYF